MVSHRTLWVVIGLIVLGVLARLIPHPTNFSPLLAVALFAGAKLPSRRLAIALPVLVMVLSDLWLGWHETLPYVYLSLALIGWMSWRKLRGEKFNWGDLAINSLKASVLFFIVSNLGVWITQDLYLPTFNGLVACFTLALPFFPNTLASTLIYSFAIFGLAAFYERRWQVGASLKLN